MQAIVTALDDPYRDEVENIWGELKAVFGLPDVSGTTRPHLTYQWAEAYDEGIASALNAIANDARRFDITTHGLGVFHATETTIYLHVTPEPMLTALHERIWAAVSPLATNTGEVFAPNTWVPHITLATGSISDDELAMVMQFLNRKPYVWRIPLTNISLVSINSPVDDQRFDLGSSSLRERLIDE